MWGWFQKSTPREVKGGLKARNKRGQIGESWWSRRFIETLESFADRNRLSRGRTYARKGQVMSLEVSPGAVTGRVQGSRRTPYRVEIVFAPLSESMWDKVVEKMAEDPVLVGELLEGSMPGTIEVPFEKAGAALFPKSRRALTLSCSCPDWGYPCKHVAAACYILAERFDTSPFEMFTWRGRDIARITEHLEAVDLKVDTAPLNITPIRDFWSSPGALDGVVLSVEPPLVPDHALRQIGAADLKYKRKDLSERLTSAYATLTASASALARGDSVWASVASPRDAPGGDPVEDLGTLDEEALLDRLDGLYDRLSEAQKTSLFEEWCADFGAFEVDGEEIDAASLWRDKEALFDLLADEDAEDLLAWLRSAMSLSLEPTSQVSTAPPPSRA